MITHDYNERVVYLEEKLSTTTQKLQAYETKYKSTKERSQNLLANALDGQDMRVMKVPGLLITSNTANSNVLDNPSKSTSRHNSNPTLPLSARSVNKGSFKQDKPISRTSSIKVTSEHDKSKKAVTSENYPMYTVQSEDAYDCDMQYVDDPEEQQDLDPEVIELLVCQLQTERSHSSKRISELTTELDSINARFKFSVDCNRKVCC